MKPGELVLAHTLSDFLTKEQPAWRLHLFLDVLGGLGEDVEGQEWQQMEEAYEVFCRATAWGSLFHVLEPGAPRSAERMAARLGALLHHWDPLQLPRYLHKKLGGAYTLGELLEEIYGRTLEAWCPGGRPVRGHIEVVVERMARATRQECIEAVLRLIPHVLAQPSRLKHREILGDPVLQRERLTTLLPEQFERFSSADAFAVYEQLASWDRELGRNQDR
ncbi:MAG TPA: hypothetical protein VEU33_37890 [Archangium sp.]|nr:hypothetical protein [Archangium sp.]